VGETCIRSPTLGKWVRLRVHRRSPCGALLVSAPWFDHGKGLLSEVFLAVDLCIGRLLMVDDVSAMQHLHGGDLYVNATLPNIPTQGD
jgi:hypothetical protein